jgi:hypothetical protein
MTTSTPGNNFEWELSPNREHETTIKWVVRKNKYEIHIPVLCRYELGHVTEHCLLVMHKINQEVGIDEATRYASYVAVLPRTLSVTLLSMWDNVLVEKPIVDDDVDGVHADITGFRTWIQLFIASNATDLDTHELLDFIRQSNKPRTMKVQAFYIRLHELNDMVEWLPGNETKLTEKQLDQAFHDAMPDVWTARYANAGRSVRMDTHAQMLHFFRTQQAYADRADFRNRTKAVDKKKNRNKEFDSSPRRGRNKWHSDAKHRLSRQEKQEHGRPKKAEAKAASNRVDDDAACPVHPGSKHTWGDCFLNARNKSKKEDNKPVNGKFKFKGKPKGKSENKSEDTVDANMHCCDHSVSSTESSECNSGSESEGSYDTPLKAAINDVSMTDDANSDDTNGYDLDVAEFIDECNLSTSHPTNNAGAVKKKQARFAKNETTSIEEGMFEVHVNLTERVTHHLNDSSFLAMQESTINITCDEIEDMFVKHCADEYSMGVSENNLKGSVDSILQLRATSYAIVQTIQHASMNCMLRVLFDSGSDKTLIKQSVLPRGINPSIGKKRKVIGVTASLIMDREVIIENMTLPEFLSTQRVSGPIRAFVIDNNEPHYDLIIGMDVMQILGIDIHNSSKTIVWDKLRVPFKPQDYFKGAFPHLLIDAMMGSPDPADTNGYKSKTIKSSHYEQSDPQVVAQQQKHLTTSQRDLALLLSKYPKLFSGKLGRYPHRKVHLELREDAKPARCRPYPVPKHHEKVFKEELDHLCTIGVLLRCGASEWLMPSFIIPKKDRRVRWISDFWALNKHIKRKVYNLPKIQDILRMSRDVKIFYDSARRDLIC